MENIELNMDERIDEIASSGVKIIQSREVFSFSIDAILLARFPRLPKRGKIVDLCAGNGAVGLFASSKTNAQIIELEIQERLADMATRSIELNGLTDRMSVINDNLNRALDHLHTSSADLIFCNPPYFKVPKGHVINPDEKKALARHELAINLEQIIKVSSDMLKMKGKMFMVHRPERLGEIMHYCLENHLSVKWVQPFVSKRNADANLVVVEAIRNTASDGLTLRDAIVVHNPDGSFTPEIEQIISENKKQKKERYYFYCLLCNDGSFYGGFTNDLKHRLKMHNEGRGAKYTKARRPVKMIYHEEFADKRLALKREYWFKHHSRKWKEEF